MDEWQTKKADNKSSHVYHILGKWSQRLAWEPHLTTVFVDTRLWKTKHPRKRFQNFHHSCVLSKDRIEIHPSKPLMWPLDLLYVMLADCVWWISIRSVDYMYDWRKFLKHFRGCSVFQGRVSTKTVVTNELFSASITIFFDIFTNSVQYAVSTPQGNRKSRKRATVTWMTNKFL